MTAGSRDEYLEMGLVDAVITKLSGVRRVGVRPTSAVLRYQGMNFDPLAAGRQTWRRSPVRVAR